MLNVGGVESSWLCLNKVSLKLISGSAIQKLRISSHQKASKLILYILNKTPMKIIRKHREYIVKFKLLFENIMLKR